MTARAKQTSRRKLEELRRDLLLLSLRWREMADFNEGADASPGAKARIEARAESLRGCADDLAHSLSRARVSSRGRPRRGCLEVVIVLEDGQEVPSRPV